MVASASDLAEPDAALSASTRATSPDGVRESVRRVRPGRRRRIRPSLSRPGRPPRAIGAGGCSASTLGGGDTGCPSSTIRTPTRDALPIAPDGTRLLFTRSPLTSPERLAHQELRLLDLTTGEEPAGRRRPGSLGHRSGLAAGLHRVVLSTATRRARAGPARPRDDGVTSADQRRRRAFTDPQVSPERTLGVRIAHLLRGPVGGGPDRFGTPSARPARRWCCPGATLRTLLHATAPEPHRDQHHRSPTAARCAAGLPCSAGPGYTQRCQIHGGPLEFRNAWSWRWCPWPLVARGLRGAAARSGAVHRIRRGVLGARLEPLGAEPFTDLMAITDTAVARDDIADASARRRWAACSAATWPTGGRHTDRFRAIVSHAFAVVLDQFDPPPTAAVRISARGRRGDAA